MKVKDLLDKLQCWNPEHDIVVMIDHDGNFRSPFRLRPCHIGDDGLVYQDEPDYPGDNCIELEI